MFCRTISRRFYILFFCLFQSFACIPLYGGDSVREMILSASGVTENDIASASSSSSISLYDAFALSVRYTERMPIEGENIVQADSEHSKAIGSYLPKISIEAVKPLTVNNSGSGSVSDKTSAYLYGRQPVITGLNEWTDIFKSKSNASNSRHQLVLSAQQQLLTVAEKYYQVCGLQSTESTDREIVDLYKKIRSELVRRVAVGKNRRNDLLRTDAQISRLEARLASVSSKLASAKSELALITGISAALPVSGGVDLPPPAFKPDDIRLIASRRVEVIIAKENIDIAGMNLTAAWGGHLPTVNLEGSYRLYTDGDDSGDKYNVAVTASIPIFQGGITGGEVSQAESVKRQADLALAQTVRTVEENINTSFQTWDGYVKQSSAYKNALVSAERNYDITISDYRLNLVTILDVISVLTELQQARNDSKTADFAAELSRIKLGVATGEFPGSGNNLLKKNYSQNNKDVK